MTAPLVIRVKDRDNVAIAVHDLETGVEVMPGVVTRDPIPQAHKVALVDIPKGGEIIRYGVVLGYAKDDIACGSWINEHMLNLPQSPSVEHMEYGTHIVPMEELPTPPRTTWMGYKNTVGPAGTRNILGIVTTVQCAAGVVNVAVQKIKQELLPKYPHVDDVVAVNHPYGCGVAINAPLAVIPIRAVRNLIRHPNFGGEIMLVGLGCEKLTYDRLLEENEINAENCLTLQDCKGHDAMMKALMEMAERKLQRLNQRHREILPLSELVVGMQCGGSDAFSGLTANPSAGYAADMLVKGGATVMFSEVTEVRDGVHMLAARCVNKEVRDKLAAEMNGMMIIWLKAALIAMPTRRQAIKKAALPISWKKPWVPSPKAVQAPLWKSCRRLKNRPNMDSSMPLPRQVTLSAGRASWQAALGCRSS